MRQYIGARYTTKIYQNSQDPGSCEWESGVIYEPLTIVSYQNSSYLSRTTVPANAGAPTVATQYWAQTGFYNGQIAQLQHDVAELQNGVSALEDDVEMLKSGKILFVADSFNAIYEAYGWDKTIIDILDLSSDDYFSIAVGGAGFAVSGSRWADILTNRLPLISDKELYKTVIVCSGGNDKTLSDDSVLAGMEDFREVVEDNFPNAKINVGYLGWTGNSADRGTFTTGCIQYKNLCPRVGFRYLRNVEYVLHNINYLRDNTAENPYDYLHPTETGCVILGRKILEALLNGTCDVIYDMTITATPNAEVTSEAQVTGTVHVRNEITELEISELYFTFVSGLNAGTGAVLGDFSCACFNPRAGSLFSPIMTDLSNYDLAPLALVFQQGKISCGTLKAMAAHRYKGAPNTFIFNTLYC